MILNTVETKPITIYSRHNGPGLGYEDFIFVTASKNFIAGLLSPLGGYLSIRAGVRPTLLLGCLCMT